MSSAPMPVTLENKNFADEAMQDYELRRASSSTELLGSKSPGVARIEHIASEMTRANKITLFLGVLIMSYAYGLDVDTRYIDNVVLPRGENIID